MGKWFQYLLIVVLFASSVHAVGISLNPATIDIKNLIRGGYAEHVITVSTSSSELLNVTMEINPEDDVYDWLTFEPSDTKFTISDNNPRKVTMIVQPPEYIPNGIYTGILKFRVQPTDEFVGQTGSVVELGVGAKLNFTVSDKEETGCRVLTSSISSPERGDPIKLSFRIYNTGNVRLNPNIKMEIWNVEKEELIKTFVYNDATLLPTVRDFIEAEINTNDMDSDQYFGDVTISPCGFKDTFTFDVMIPGSVSMTGRLIQIKNKVWNNVGDIIDVKPVFENTGERKVSAIFKGTISIDSQVFGNLESGYIMVEPGQTVEFPLTFEPKQPGRYVVKGRIFYEDKQTFEKTNIINVNPAGVEVEKKEDPESSMIYFSYIILVIGILVILILIRKKKR